MRRGLASILLTQVLFAVVLPCFASDVQRYTDARRAQLAGEPAKAYPLFTQVSGAPYRVPARLYAAQCLQRLQRHGEADELARESLTIEGAELYKGELLLLRSEIAYVRGELGRAAEFIEACRAWVALRADGVERGGERWISPGLTPASALVNHETAGWYRFELTEYALLWHAFVQHERGDTGLAIETLGQGGEARSGRVFWLAWELGDGELFVMPHVRRAGVSGMAQRRLAAASFHVAIGAFGRARPVFADLAAQTRSGKGDANQWAVALLGEAACAHGMGQHHKAVELLRPFDGVLRNTTPAAEGQLALAGLLSERAADWRGVQAVARRYEALLELEQATRSAGRLELLLHALCQALASDDTSRQFDLLGQVEALAREQSRAAAPTLRQRIAADLRVLQGLAGVDRDMGAGVLPLAFERADGLAAMPLVPLDPVSSRLRVVRQPLVAAHGSIVVAAGGPRRPLLHPVRPGQGVLVVVPQADVWRLAAIK